MTSTISNSSTMPQSFDRNKFLERCMGNSILVEKLIVTLRTTIPTEKAKLQSAILAREYAEIARVAHQIRGTAANVCASPLSEAAHRLEQAAHENRYDVIAKPWLELSEQMDVLVHALAAEVQA